MNSRSHYKEAERQKETEHSLNNISKRLDLLHPHSMFIQKEGGKNNNKWPKNTYYKEFNKKSNYFFFSSSILQHKYRSCTGWRPAEANLSKVEEQEVKNYISSVKSYQNWAFSFHSDFTTTSMRDNKSRQNSVIIHLTFSFCATKFYVRSGIWLPVVELGSNAFYNWVVFSVHMLLCLLRAWLLQPLLVYIFHHMILKRISN